MTMTAIEASADTPAHEMAERFSVKVERLMQILASTIIKTADGRQATKDEVAAFVLVANQYKLNPFTREIHAFADRNRGIVPIVGIDGWSKIANSQEEFDGCDFEDEADSDGKPVAVTCVMHIKGRSHPIRVKERFSECKRNTPPWTGMPWRMLRHKAFMQACRLAFSIGGIMDEDEARDTMQNNGATAQPVQDQHERAQRLTKKIAGVTVASALPCNGNGHSEAAPAFIPEAPADESPADPPIDTDVQPEAPAPEQADPPHAEPESQEPHPFTDYDTFTAATKQELKKHGATEEQADKQIEAMEVKYGCKGRHGKLKLETRIQIYEAAKAGKAIV